MKIKPIQLEYVVISPGSICSNQNHHWDPFEFYFCYTGQPNDSGDIQVNKDVTKDQLIHDKKYHVSKNWVDHHKILCKGCKVIRVDRIKNTLRW